MRIVASFLIIILGINMQIAKAQNSEAYDILQTMVKKASEVKTIEYNAVMNERINGKMVEKQSFFKINSSPVKIYVRQSFIGIKLDGLYCEGSNKNLLLICTHGFPWLQLSLDPLGKRVRDNHHHTIFEAGFNFFVGLTNEIISKGKNDLDISMNPIPEMKDGRTCYKITIKANNFKYIPYTIKAGENITTIAKQRNISDYMILEKNNIDYFTDVKAGQNILIPTIYGSQMVLYLDKSIMLPVQIDVFDDKGLYGSYFYKNLKINKEFAWNEFTTTFKDYHFR
jgi:outer membrane lipoprotein-sorting protein